MPMSQTHTEAFADLHAEFQRFKEEHGIHVVIAVSGSAQTRILNLPPEHPIVQNYLKNLDERIAKVVSDCLGQFREFAVAIMTGGTQDGVPRIASEIAHEMGLKLIFVSPLRAKKYRIDHLSPDLDFLVPPLVGDSQWGDESALYAQLLDGALVIGGNTGTLIECAHVFKINESIVGKKKKEGANEKVKYLVPIRGFGGISETLHFLCPRDEVRLAAMPLEGITDGLRAGKLLLEHTEAYTWYEN